MIREELDGPGAASDRTRRRSVGVLGHEDEIDEAELCDRASVSPDLVRQLEEFGLLVSRSEGGERLYAESEADIAAVCAARALRDRRAPPPDVPDRRRSASRARRAARRARARARNPQRRKDALEDLEALSRVAQELSHLLLVRELRGTVERDGVTLDLRDRIRDVPDFPTEGVIFKDLMPLIADPEYFAETIHRLAEWARPT